MFETTDFWTRLADEIDLRAALAKAEIRLMAERARDEIDIRLGYSASFIRRSRGQRARWARQQLREANP